MRGKFVSGPAAMAVLLLFFLPWITVADGTAAGQVSGYRLALDGTDLVDVTLLLVPLAAAAVLLLLLLVVMSKRRASAAVWGQGAVALVALLVLGWQWRQISGEFDSPQAVSVEPALWGTIAALLLILTGVAVDLLPMRQQRPQKRAPASAPRHWGRDRERPQVGTRTIVDWPDERKLARLRDRDRPQRGTPTLVDDPPPGTSAPSTASLGSAYRSLQRDLATDEGLDEIKPAPAGQPRSRRTDLSTDFGTDSLPSERLSPKTEVLKPEQELLAWLVVRSGEPVGKQFRLRQITTIGRDPNCDIRINDTAMSGKHAEVKIEDGHFFIYDHGSTNGVLVYEPESDRWQKVERQELKDGTQIKLGRTVLHLMTLVVDDQ